MNEKYKTGLLIGRFQPFHKGHLWLIKHSLKSVDSLVIGIGSANIYDRDNPFSFDDRKEMIDIVIRKEKIKDRIKKIIPLDDFYNDDLWFQDTLRVTGGQFDIVIGNNEWVNRIFEKPGYKILRVGYYKRYLYEGEKIRKLLKYTYSRRPLQIGKPRTIVVRGKEEWIKRVPRYLVAMIKKSYMLHVTLYKFDHIALGGTFDHLHEGHKALIDKAFELGKFVTIGLATKKIYQDKFLSQTIESYSKRQKALIDYLSRKKYVDRYTFFSINDIFGPSISDKKYEAVVVSKATYQNAITINKLRKEKNLPPLEIVIVPDVLGEDGKLITSQSIRAGKIDREGKSYDLRLMIKAMPAGRQDKRIKHLILPEYLKEELRKPLGKVIRESENELEKTAQKALHYINIMKSKPPMVIAVGDIIYISLIHIDYIPDVGIIDYRSRRTIIDEISNIKDQISKLHIKNQKEVKNQSGTVSKQAIDNISASLKDYIKTKERQLIVVDGEEDLLALPAILFAPLNSIVLYGQMDLGVVIIEVTEEKKKQISKIVKKFTD